MEEIEDLRTATNLAFIGSIKDDILDMEEIAAELLSEVKRLYPDKIAQRYKLNAQQMELDRYELLEAIGRKRGMLISGGEVDLTGPPLWWWMSSARANWEPLARKPRGCRFP